MYIRPSYLVPLIRVNRALVSTLIYPQQAIIAVSVSELSSVILPFFDPFMYKRLLGLLLSFIYGMDELPCNVIEYYREIDYKYYQTEICLLLLFVTAFELNELNNLSIIYQ